MEEEQLLIQGLRDRQLPALRQFLGLYQQRVYNTALSLIKNEQEAEEIAQDVFLVVWDSISGFKGESSLFTWVYRITIRKSLDLIKSKGRKKRFAFIRSLSSPEINTGQHAVNWVHPGVIEENREKAKYLFNAIERLPDNQKVAFTLSKLEQLGQKEIAAIMQLNEGAVESLLQRAKQNLRKQLEKIYEELR